MLSLVIMHIFRDSGGATDLWLPCPREGGHYVAKYAAGQNMQAISFS